MKNNLWMTSLIFLTSVSLSAELEVKFSVDKTLAQMAGTIHFPENGGQIGMVLLPVAGPTDRDLTLGSHKYFAELADGLALAGISTLRFDDRGTNQSTGDFFATTLEDRAKDACKAREKLAEVTKIKPDNIGFLGMSEGSGLAIMAASYCDDIPFRILLSAPLRTGQIELTEQMDKLIKGGTFTADQKKEISIEAHKFLRLISADEPNESEILAMLESPYGALILPPYYFVPKEPEKRVQFVMTPWYQSQIHYDISADLKKFNEIPTLGVYGEKDRVIDAAANYALMRKTMPNAKLHTIKSLNHLMQDSITGSPMEYAQLPNGFSPQVIEIISNWVLTVMIR